MKLLRLKIFDSNTCGGLLNGVEIPFRVGDVDIDNFSPICLIGPNGAGKSQVLQIIAEIFQAVFAYFIPDEEQGTPNKDIFFEIEYLLYDSSETSNQKKVKIHRVKEGRKKTEIIISRFLKNEWNIVDSNDEIKKLLPSKVIGYTSGDNETLSIPFFVSRAGYAKQVSNNARDKIKATLPIADSRMLLIDYGTNLEVLIANLLLNPINVRQHLVNEPNLKKLRSFRCVIQLKYSSSSSSKVLLTDELKGYVEYLKNCCTCFIYDEHSLTYTFDFYVQDATYSAFSDYWKGGALELYSCFHKLAMLNDLVINKTDREAFIKGVEQRRFSSRLPEPMERQKVFRFERVEFISQKSEEPVDYVSLSDGEHQLTQLLGTLCMASFPNVLFLLDEPESHFNPRWRVEFISKIFNLPTSNIDKNNNEGKRSEKKSSAKQEFLITTHSPFVPSDMHSDNVMIFKKDDNKEIITIRRPNIQTYGSTFDTILDECFGINPPMSDIPKNEIDDLLESENIDEIKEAINRLGDSVERIYLADRVRMLSSKKG
ncbi:restriction system-associated AAA family ATPase [Pantoea agglomerans]|uniref:restriction system-associated AAA family ATPase n=1 Tax=Enterobacter agglomerans TaxID=549 RepID=UPI003CF1E5E1